MKNYKYTRKWFFCIFALLIMFAPQFAKAEGETIRNYPNAISMGSAYFYDFNFNGYNASKSNIPSNWTKGNPGDSWVAYYDNAITEDNGEKYSLRVDITYVGVNQYEDLGRIADEGGLDRGIRLLDGNEIAIFAFGDTYDVKYTFYTNTSYTTIKPLKIGIGMIDPDQANYLYSNATSRKLFYIDKPNKPNEVRGESGLRLIDYYNVMNRGLIHISEQGYSDYNYMTWPDFQDGTFAIEMLETDTDGFTLTLEAKQDYISLLQGICKIQTPYEVRFYYEDEDGFYFYHKQLRWMQLYSQTSVTQQPGDNVPNPDLPKTNVYDASLSDVVKTITPGSFTDNHLDIYFDRNLTIKYNGNGGECNMEPDIYRVSVDSMPSASIWDVDRFGYKFIGWKIENEGELYTGSKDLRNELLNDADGEIELYAQWEEIPKAVIIYHDMTDDVELYRTDPILGEAGEEVVFDDYDRVNSYVDQGYIVSEFPFDNIINFPDSGTLEITIELVHDIIIEDGLIANIRRIITYGYEDGHLPIPAPDDIDEISFSYAISTDAVTGAVDNPLDYAIAIFSDVESPYVPGYSPDEDIIHGEERKFTDGDAIYNVVYSPIHYAILFEPNWPENKEGYGYTYNMYNLEYDETYPLSTNQFGHNNYIWTSWNTEADGSGISFEDEEQIMNLAVYDGEPVFLYAQWIPKSEAVIIYRDLTDNKEIKRSDIYYGVSGEAIPTEEHYENMTAIVNLGYKLAITKDPMSDSPVFPNSGRREIVVEFEHSNDCIVGTILTVTRTIEYKFTDGRTPVPENVIEKQQAGPGGSCVDRVTGKKTDTLENATVTFTSVKSPIIAGYHTDRETVLGVTVSAKGEDFKETVVYSPNQYKVVYHPNGAKGDIYSQSVTYNVKGKFYENKFDSSCKFIEWNTMKDRTGKAVKPGEEFFNLTSDYGGEIQLYAQWDCGGSDTPKYNPPSTGI